MGRQWNGLPLVIFGIGGLATQVKGLVDDINKSSNNRIYDLLGYVSNNSDDIGQEVNGLKIIISNDLFEDFSKKNKLLGIAIAIGAPSAKQTIEENILIKCDNIVCPNLIHPNANIPAGCTNDLGIGSIIFAGVSFATNIKLGNFVVVNFNSTVGHDITIEDYCTINPLSCISANVKVKKGSLIGACASIKENLILGQNSTAGLGAIVVKDIEENTTVICKAATKMEKK